MAVIKLDNLTSVAKTYDPMLRVLPFNTLNDAARRMRFNIINVEKGEHIIRSKRRKGDIVRPYVPSALQETTELLDFYEAKLKPEIVYAQVPDNVTNYEDYHVLSNQGESVDNKSKKHPLEYLLLQDIAISFGEDISYNIFTAERDVTKGAAAVAADSFNGFNKTIKELVTSGLIAEANKNQFATGAFPVMVDPDGEGVEPAVETDGYLKLLEFLRSADPALRRGEVILYAADHVMNNVVKWYQTHVSNFSDPTREQVVAMLRDKANIPNLQVISEPEFATGSQLMLIKPGLIELGTRMVNDQQFVQVRSVEVDPNKVQFWCQSAYDTRIIDIHRKVFLCNDQYNSITADFVHSGDY